LHLVARIDRFSPEAVVEQVMSAYLERRLEALHEAHDERAGTERVGRVRVGRVIDLAARRTAQRPTHSFDHRVPQAILHQRRELTSATSRGPPSI
jgi:hypothetical protein